MSTFIYYYTLFIRQHNQFKQHMLITTTDKVHGYQLFTNRTLVPQFSKTFNFKVKLSLVFKAIRTIKIISCLPKLFLGWPAPYGVRKDLKIYLSGLQNEKDGRDKTEYSRRIFRLEPHVAEGNMTADEFKGRCYKKSEPP